MCSVRVAETRCTLLDVAAQVREGPLGTLTPQGPLLPSVELNETLHSYWPGSGGLMEICRALIRREGLLSSLLIGFK